MYSVDEYVTAIIGVQNKEMIYAGDFHVIFTRIMRPTLEVFV